MSHRAPLWRGMVGVSASLLGGVLLLGWATDGFAVLTSDRARARRVQRTPVVVPVVPVRDHRGEVHAVLHDTVSRPRAAIVDFVYTRCLTVCGALGGTYQALQHAIVARGLHDKVRLLTVSFDVARDDPTSLALYARMQRAEPRIWSLATPVDSIGRERLLRTFGVQVVPDGVGGWVHNAALHVVDPTGRLVRIVDIGDLEGALALAVQAWEGAP